MKLKTIEFIKTHSNWKELLVEKPYCLIIKEDENYYLLRYSQIGSNFKEEIVKECRGLIIDKNTLEPLALSFYKFFNYGEPGAASIDWSSARVTSKIDGSKILVWYHNNKWHISTSGTIDAYTANVSNLGYTFGQLFEEAIDNSTLTKDDFWSMLKKDRCYTFELVSPKSTVVIRYPKTKIYLIGVRNINTFEEIDPLDDCLSTYIYTPAIHFLYSEQDCIEAASVLPADEEGYVVRDKYFNRIKVKSPTYVALAHINDNGVQSLNRLLEIVEYNEIDEFCNYFPEWKEKLEEIKKAKDSYLDKLEAKRQSLEQYINEVGEWVTKNIRGSIITCLNPSNRKEAAIFIMKNYPEDKGFLFKYLDNKYIAVLDYWQEQSTDNKVGLLKLKEETKDV